MGYRAVALSQVGGAGGEHISYELARKLGFAYLNEAIVAQVAAGSGVDPASVTEAERRKSFVTRVFEAAGRARMDGVRSDSALYLFDETDRFLSLIKNTVRDAADRGNVVLVAHAACYACADRLDVLRVWVTAPLPVRVSRVASQHGISESEAAKSVRQSDAGRASYLKRVYGIGKESPADYDLVVNTERLMPDDAVDIVIGLVQSSSASPLGASGG
jgi:cytidylate kinase